jgi:predicted amidohydrolase
MSKFTVAAVQMTTGADKSENVSKAIELVEQAAGRGAQLVVLPELFNCLGAHERISAGSESIPGPTATAMGQLAARLQITLLAGSIAERVAESDKAFNTSLLFGPDGRQLASYRKIHLFDIDLPGRLTHRESDVMQAGDRLVASETPVGKLGLGTCYDLRFPELFRRLSAAGAQILCLPAAFTLTTGRDHWEPLLRARAIENQTYVIAANQFGQNAESIRTCGRSTIIDPWGIPLATAADGENVITAEIDLDYLVEIRRNLPALEHRRDPHKLQLED